jgi:hypothetical protein
MGGRGATSGVSSQGQKYGTEFKTLMSVDDISLYSTGIPQRRLSHKKQCRPKNRAQVKAN